MRRRTRLKAVLGNRWLHPLLLLLWIAIGTGLRFTRLAGKPPWTDEFSTIVFSLGNSFRTVPLDLAIAIDILLQPLQPNPDAGITDVVRHLLTESNHPPLYFVLAHWWMQLWPPDATGLASVWAARALPALLGAVSIPAIYGLSWLAFRSQLVGQMAAAMVAVSPYGIFLAQEARHYTLAILWVIGSLCCLAIATHYIYRRIPFPTWVAVSWVIINFVGISTHYFFSFTLCAEAFWLIILGWHQRKEQGRKVIIHSPPCPPIPRGDPETPLSPSPWWQISAVAVGTTVGGLIWLPVFWQESYGGELTDWIQSGDRGLLAWISPVFQALAAWITMFSLLPVEAASLPIVIASVLVMLGFFLWAVPILSRNFRIQLQQPTTSLMTQMFAVVVVGAIALFFVFTYAFGIDLTRGARYNFVYFPAVSVLLGVSLSVYWSPPTKRAPNPGIALLPRILGQDSAPNPGVALLPRILGQDRQKRLNLAGRKAVALVWSMGLISGLTIVCNLGYHKYYRPEILVPLIQKVSQSPALIATTYKTHVQIGEMMGLAREFKLSGSSVTPLFLLAHQAHNPNPSTTALQHTLTQLPRPLDLWLVNFHAPVELKGCIADRRSFPYVDGYEYQLYHCSLASPR